MQTTTASKTALATSLMRALHTREAAHRIIDDPWGDRLVPDAVREAIWQRALQDKPNGPAAAEGASRSAVVDAWLRASPACASVITRSRYAEDALHAAVARGCTQVVMVRAGFDSDALRTPAHAAQLAIFEVDHPATQALKRHCRGRPCGQRTRLRTARGPDRRPACRALRPPRPEPAAGHALRPHRACARDRRGGLTPGGQTHEPETPPMPASAADPFDLERFFSAQERDYAQALRELRAGRKQTHWIWYVLPQLRGLGVSEMSHCYGLSGLEEAQAYLAHPVLGLRLVECVEAISAHRGRAAAAILGDLDAMKYQSCLTLFAAASGDAESVFAMALQSFFAGVRDGRTVQILKRSQSDGGPGNA